MKLSVIGVAATAVLLPVALAAQHERHLHQHFHDHLRRQENIYTHTQIVTNMVTVTADNAIVWVDQNGKVVWTEYLSALTTPTSIPASVTDVPTSTSTTTTSVAPAETSSHDVGQNPTPGANVGSSSSAGYGICYELIADNHACKSADQIASDFGFLKGQGFAKVRTYDIGCDIGVAISAAQSIGLGIMIGLNGIDNLESNLQKMIGLVNGNWGPVITVNIGNELVNNGVKSAGQVSAAVETARGILRGAGFQGSVVTVDTFIAMKNNPAICSTSDYCAVNAHSYFDPTVKAENAGSWVLDNISSIGAATGKTVIVTESGWPTRGTNNGNAIPSIQNQQAAMSSVKNAFAGNPAGVFLFQAYNAGYKNPGHLGVEPFFGIFGH